MEPESGQLGGEDRLPHYDEVGVRTQTGWMVAKVGNSLDPDAGQSYYEYEHDWGWDSEPLLPVPGFGFLPAALHQELDQMTRVG